MSSELLKQAMVDAAALKEAAIKNAENALIEKYSQEFNTAVQKILEQQTEPMPSTPQEIPPPAAAAPASPMPAPAGGIDPATADPMADMSAGLPGLDGEVSDAFSSVPGSFGADTDEDEMVTINFDKIKAMVNEMYDAGRGMMTDVTPDALSGVKTKISVVGEKEPNTGDVEYELDLEDDSLSEFESTDQDFEGSMPLESAAADIATASQQKAEAERKLSMAQSLKAKEELDAEKEVAAAQSMAGTGVQEDIELTEEELSELAEELKVDLDPGNTSRGWMGTTEGDKRERRDLELAAARDEQAAEDREEEKKKLGDLMKENTDLKKLNNEALEIVASLKVQVEKLNILNAKLLYTNKALANISLNERQKNNIVESISRADSVLAAKTIYETVQNAVESSRMEQPAPQSLREALNRAATPFAVRKSAQNGENNPMADRMKALAGIK